MTPNEQWELTAYSPLRLHFIRYARGELCACLTGSHLIWC